MRFLKDLLKVDLTRVVLRNKAVNKHNIGFIE